MYPFFEEATALNKKIGRLIRPNMGVYFVLLFVFAAASFYFKQYLLAGIELGVLVIGLVLYLVLRANRKKAAEALLG